MTGSLILLSAIWAALAVLVFAMSFSVPDITGRVRGEGWGKRINARRGWFWMELPALAVFPAIYVAIGNFSLAGNIAVVLWLAHYGHRTLVWPWIVMKANATVPSGMWLSGAVFNVINGALLGAYFGLAADYADGWLSDPRFLLGLTLFVLGAALNNWADYRMLRLRRQSGAQRVLPIGGAFNTICCPNLAGEIIEWIGFALLTWCLPALAFALWTLANLIPRALWRRNLVPRKLPRFPEEPRRPDPGNNLVLRNWSARRHLQLRVFDIARQSFN